MPLRQRDDQPEIFGGRSDVLFEGGDLLFVLFHRAVGVHCASSVVGAPLARQRLREEIERCRVERVESDGGLGVADSSLGVVLGGEGGG